MTYDFETVLDRRGTNSVAADVIPFDEKPDEGFDPIPMWIADMAYPVAPPVLEAMRRRLELPTLGYYRLSDEYFDSILSWQRRRNGVEGLEKEHIGYENGVLGGVASAVQAFTSPGEKILVHSPTYVGFTHTIENLGRVLVHSPLRRDEKGIWRMDYADMDAKIREHAIHLVIFCSPHNPSGRVWEREEIERAMEVYRDNGCLVISDEIWSDIVMPGYKHIPTQSVGADARERTLAFYAPSKTFSLAGLVGSYHIVYNKYPEPLQLLLRAVDARADRRLFARGRGMGRADDPRDRRQLRLRLRLHRGALPRREGHAPAGDLHALPRLSRFLRRARRDDRRAAAPRRARGCDLAERRGLRLARDDPHEPGPAPLPPQGGHGAAGKVRLRLRAVFP